MWAPKSVPTWIFVHMQWKINIIYHTQSIWKVIYIRSFPPYLWGIGSRTHQDTNPQMLKSHSWPYIAVVPHAQIQSTTDHVLLYVVIEKESMYKWTHAGQIRGVQGSTVLTFFIMTATPWGRNYYLYFTNEETEAHITDLSKLTQQ